jgi:hypothetical protein
VLRKPAGQPRAQLGAAERPLPELDARKGEHGIEVDAAESRCELTMPRELRVEHGLHQRS